MSALKEEEENRDWRSNRDKSNKKCNVALRSPKDVSSDALRQGLKIQFCSL